jgi:hypothetical protein
MDVPGLFAVGAVAVVLVAGAVLQNEQKMTKNVSWILKINGFRPGSGERPLLYTIIVNNNIKNENTNDGVEGYQWLFAVTKMLNNITITHCETGLVAWTRFP